ncbi:IMP cyclohydrolase [Pseudobacteroides cellulosolvens]|uniref:Inosine monophosphate cyclohydrolase-like protein n=1 Tax=Pseudobacteroides cellulosolvens ATCC 35603 = DSM 2933 TaxID=398512 RepID=A0A0L6JJB1_9FIRM|nr:IMP cyclohydrolase [Pseudobacteroides cellulosolvens]KNY25517.1 Inosine monophosphate cyclohydrolase-like protein [Pseudobacteroides cellulosolvens ATCC 35603 = DSM 2933]
MGFEEIASANENRIKHNNYPGRGIVIGKTPDSKSYVQIYWIMGRSSNSRNRVFVIEGDCVKTKAFDENKMEDPSLIIYYPIKSYLNFHIVGNGDQTDTVFDYIRRGKDFESALNTRDFEPDFPNYTPRISGIVDLNERRYVLSILKTINNAPELAQKNYYNYNKGIDGYGHCIHTYREDGHPIPSFEGEPFIVKLHDKIEQNANYYWNLLNEDNRISLLIKYIEIESRNVVFKIINKNI